MGTQILAWLSSLIIGSGVVWGFISRYKGKIGRALRITKETLDVLDGIMIAVEDKKITKQELEQIMAQVEELQDALK